MSRAAPRGRGSGAPGASVDRRYLGLSVTRFLPTGLTMPVTGLLMLSRGLSLADVGLGIASQALMVIVLELPTGGLADTLGRRPVLLVATALDVAALALLLAAHSPAAFMAAMAVQGAYRALESGPLDAWYVDASLAADAGRNIESGLALGGVAVGFGVATGSLVTAALTAFRPVAGVAPLALPLAVALALRVLDLAALSVFLRDARSPPALAPASASASAGVGGRGGVGAGVRAGVAATPAVVRSALRLLRGSPALMALVAVEVSWGAGLVGVELLSAPRLAELLGDAEGGATVSAVAAALAWTVSAAGSALTGWFSRLVGGGPARVGAAGRIAQGAAVALAAVVAGPAGLVAGYLAFYLVHGASNAVHYGMVHRLVDADHRATVISAHSVAGRLGALVAGVGLGAVASGAGIPVALGVAAVVLASAAPLYRVAGRLSFTN